MKRALAAASAAALCGSALAGDVIVLTDGRTLGVSPASDPPTATDFAASNLAVTEENLDGIVYRAAGVATKQTLPRAQVKRVFHDPATMPADLAEGLALIAAGRLDEARSKLASAARNSASPLWAQSEAAFRRAESYASEGALAAAERALASFAQDRSRSRWVLDARGLRARILLDLGRDEDAKAEYEAASRTQGATEDEALGARFLANWAAARGALRSGDTARAADAAKTFDAIRPQGTSRAALALRCDVAKAACGAAVEGLAARVAASGDPFVLAVGHTLLADAASRRGRQTNDRAAREEAQEGYLKVVLLYRDAEGALDFVAAAQFHAGELFIELAPADTPAAALAKARARREWEDLVRRAPRSEWAKKARAALAAP
jgi:hypothetical protein